MRNLTVFSAMREATRRKAAPKLSAVDGGRGWMTLFSGNTSGDIETGDWQRNIRGGSDSILGNDAVYACISLISGDISKLRIKLVERIEGIWGETDSPSFSPVLRKPNRYQTRQQFIESWICSKLIYGNTYVLKQRDNRGVVVALYVLDANRIVPLVAPNGLVYYQVQEDNLSQVQADIPAVPASEIIHDRMNCFFHPLIGLPPIFASCLAATQGLKIQKNSAKFFENMSRPSGILTGPDEISDTTALRLKENWERNYSGNNTGKVAVLGDGLDYKPMTVTPIDAELTAQLKLSAERVCTAFLVPSFKINVGTIPAGQKVADLDQIYYSSCLQRLMESVEALLDEGLGLDKPKDGKTLGTEFELDDLLKMDPVSLSQAVSELVKAGIAKPNEGRRRFNLSPVEGGDSPMLQQQNYSLEALAKRDASADPFGKAAVSPVASPPAADTSAKAIESVSELVMSTKGLAEAARDEILKIGKSLDIQAPPVQNVVHQSAPSVEVAELTQKFEESQGIVRELLNTVLEMKSESASERAAREKAEQRRLEEIAKNESADQEFAMFAEAVTEIFEAAIVS